MQPLCRRRCDFDAARTLFVYVSHQWARPEEEPEVHQIAYMATVEAVSTRENEEDRSFPLRVAPFFISWQAANSGSFTATLTLPEYSLGRRKGHADGAARRGACGGGEQAQGAVGRHELGAQALTLTVTLT